MKKVVLKFIPALICGVVVVTLIARCEQPDAFVSYLKKNGQAPKSFVLDKLANHKLVIYGETHKRKASWDLLKSVINDPSFSKRTGIVFLEMSSDSQEKMDRFFANESMDREIILDILRSVQSEGWDDRGMYEFVIDLWNLNRRLDEKEKIKVVLADIQRPFGSMKTQEDLLNWLVNAPDRDQQMADIIEASMKSRKDERGGLFIVGMGHAFKARIETDKFKWISAGARLKERFSEQDVFITLTHMPIMDNSGNVEGLTNNGIFDNAFERNRNKPVAFDLAGSPFGKERFDVITELNSFEGVGNYEDNFDGYIFLMPLKDEGPHYLLPELISEDFIQELRRRNGLVDGLVDGDWVEYGANLKEITLDDVRKYYQEQAQSKHWKNLKE